jgi:cytochrome b561
MGFFQIRNPIWIIAIRPRLLTRMLSRSFMRFTAAMRAWSPQSGTRRAMSTAESAPTSSSSYTTAVQAMHWAMGVSVLGTFAFVNMAQQTTDKKKKMDYMFIHKSFGTAAAMLLVPRLGIRLASSHPGHLTSVAWEKFAAAASHTAMYGFLIAMPATGVAMGYFGGKGLPFFFTTLPGASGDSKDGKLAGKAFKLHKQLGQPMEYVFCSMI